MVGGAGMDGGAGVVGGSDGRGHWRASYALLMSETPGSGRRQRTPREAPTTVTEAVDLLIRDGYTADFELVDGALRTEGGNSPCAVGEVVVERLYRFEGPSDPGDQMIVFGLLDPISDIRGTLASAFGPAADPELYEHLAHLSSRWR